MSETNDEFLDRPVSTASSRGAEPGPSLVLQPHMVFGSGLTDPLDYLVLIHTLYLAVLGKPFTPAAVLASLRAEGVRSGNGSGLVGRDAVYASFKRLVEAGFLRRVQEGEPGKFGRVSYELYQYPEYNPAWSPVSVKPQVSPDTAMPEAGNRTNGKAAGQPGYGNAGSAVPGYGNAGSGMNDKAAGQPGYGNAGSGSGIPPVPPKGEVTPPPYPPHASAATSNAVTQGGEGERSAQHTPEQLQAAANFLRDLPEHLAINSKMRRKLAPLLLDQIREEAWELGPQLLAELSKDQGSGPVKNAASTVKYRIDHLRPCPASARPGTAGRPPAGAARCEFHPARLKSECPCQTAYAAELAREAREAQAAGRPDTPAPTAPAPAPADAPTPAADQDTDPAVVETAKKGLRELKAGPSSLRPARRAPKGQRARENATQRHERETEQFEQTRADALRALEERFPEVNAS